MELWSYAISAGEDSMTRMRSFADKTTINSISTAMTSAPNWTTLTFAVKSFYNCCDEEFCCVSTAPSSFRNLSNVNAELWYT